MNSSNISEKPARGRSRLTPLLQAWRKLSDSAVAAGWDFSGEITDDEDSENSDEDFELRMTADTDDEDIAVLQAEVLEGEEEDE
jgi:hypothetical protein